MMFRDQVGILAGWFKGWNECEQTVALLSLLKRITRTQARFLQLCLEHSLADCTEIHIVESEANSAGETPCLAPEPPPRRGEAGQAGPGRVPLLLSAGCWVRAAGAGVERGSRAVFPKPCGTRVWELLQASPFGAVLPQRCGGTPGPAMLGFPFRPPPQALDLQAAGLSPAPFPRVLPPSAFTFLRFLESAAGFPLEPAPLPLPPPQNPLSGSGVRLCPCL